MKALLYSALLLGLAFLAFDRFGQPPAQRALFTSALTARLSTLLGEQNAALLTGIPSAPATHPATTSLAATKPTDDIPPVPQFETLESLTRNWTTMPPSAFPREVTLTRDIEFTMPGGSAKRTPGAKALALAITDGQLTLAPTATSAARASVPLDSTDLKAQIRDSYTKWVQAKAQQYRDACQRRRNATTTTGATTTGPNGEPPIAPDGSCPLLLASMKSGQVSEITPKRIKAWHVPQLQTIDGKPTWTIDVEYDTIVYCGPITARAQAHIRDGRVLRWIYPGSGEPVP